MLLLLILCCASAFVATALLVRYGRGHTHRYGPEVPQRFHAGNVPRLGGIGMLAGCTVGWSWMALSERMNLANQIRFDFEVAASLWLVAFLTVAAGAFEDLTQRLPAVYRLLLTMAAAMMAVGLLNLTIPRLGLYGIERVQQYGLDDQMSWLLIPLLGFTMAAAR